MKTECGAGQRVRRELLEVKLAEPLSLRDVLRAWGEVGRGGRGVPSVKLAESPSLETNLHELSAELLRLFCPGLFRPPELLLWKVLPV